MKRWPLFAAIAYVVLTFASAAVVPTAPEANASGAEVIRYFANHAAGMRTAMWLITWSMVPLVLFLAALRARLVGIGRDVMVLGAAALVVETMIWTWFNLGLALHGGVLDPKDARLALDISAYFGPTLTVAIVLVVVPVGIAAWKQEGFPRWLAWLTIVFAVEQSIETITIFGTRGFIAPGGPMNFLLGAGLYAIWIIAAGVAVSSPVTTLSPRLPDPESSRPSEGR